MSRYILIFFALFSIGLQAQWFESSATTIVLNGDWDRARERALKKAVKNALIFSGGAISSLQQVSNGVLVENRLLLNSEGEIKALIIVDEKKQGDSLRISIKVDIQAPEKACYSSRFPKSIAITRFKLNTPEQATDGNIFTINKQITQTLFSQLKLSPQSLNVRQLIDYPVKLGEQYHDNRQADTLYSLATKTDSQFLIYGEINDISVKFQSKNSFGYWLSNPDRHFYLTIYLYDALQGQLLSTKQYRTKAPWQYNKHETANLQSKLFWQRDYGQAIIALLDDVTIDIEQQLQCQQPTAKVVSVETNSLKINLGKRNGLKNDTILSLFYSSNYKDQFGIERSSKSQYQGAMKVIEVENNSAVLRTLDNIPLGNIQINDLARIE
ncbi:flagellar assembly protein T N-terminal domain-containing protein [Psychromonas hadalis]|uniref:flagellar assembly protein T N-terminal domain-containing protein n=1 Tax=Psychromonas hadalis TaxID=211669 RepID=UPI0003B3B40E|nr:flagellar assembly protein T N-terminal domain-containing protein [Psychromonas hadalis]